MEAYLEVQMLHFITIISAQPKQLSVRFSNNVLLDEILLCSMYVCAVCIGFALVCVCVCVFKRTKAVTETVTRGATK